MAASNSAREAAGTENASMRNRALGRACRSMVSGACMGASLVAVVVGLVADAVGAGGVTADVAHPRPPPAAIGKSSGEKLRSESS